MICAPAYSEVLGLTTEVILGPEDGLPRTSALRLSDADIRSKLTDFVGALSADKIASLNRALAQALDLPEPR